jgi:hypothetical protein
VSVRTARWLLFLAFALTLPLPMLGPFAALVPAVRYAILFSAAAAVAVAEGAAGPVPAVLTLLGLHALAGLLGCGLAAWLAGVLLARLSPRARRGLVLGAGFALLAAASAFELYRTPFGRAPRASLWGVLS